ncbi:SGNH/GDSL hydrolase family protein [Pseudofrankia inefficax]|uniref:Putative signal peptide-containing protein n=1 Tax=Pseudofrankia inefficax (strain DSM 45817 / CECT 9037 / DDB 130130 / EuI1c) TaxID=298654 RepID=E3J840_PSEI1|nr:signal peptide-containing protein [Pseudofrankia inefficax]ADP82088.1 putative signal peptide-containing protein [Pseudofrankia inefficax]
MALGQHIQRPRPTRAAATGHGRIVLWGDSLAWEARGPFTHVATLDGDEVLDRTWPGTAICDYVADMRTQIRDWHPTVAVLSFSGNGFTPCMRGRDPLTAYREDASTAVALLRAAGVQVRLVVSPPRRGQPVDSDGLTDLGRVYRDVAAANPGTQVSYAGFAVTVDGQWSATLPCSAPEPCNTAGTVTVRAPDGTHFCPDPDTPPVPTANLVDCPVYSPGAERFGLAIAVSLGLSLDGLLPARE